MISDQLRCLYLHGFKSSAMSAKAQLTMAFFAQHDLAHNLHIPNLSAAPQQAMDEAMFLYEQLIDEVGQQNVLVIGSSLGGYYASYLVEHYGGKAVVINPSIRPYELLNQYLGENENYHTGERFEVTQDYLTQLTQLDTPQLQYPMQHLLMVQTHDETLDYKEAVQKYLHCPAIIEYGGDHGFQGYEQRLPSIIHFAQA